MQQLNAEQEALLKKHLELVIEANKRTNITRIDDWGQGWLLHVEDSLSGADEVSAAPDGPLADLGSGAGYPGIPLAITTTREITLVESVGKKASLLSGFARELGLDEKIRVYSGRAEQLAQEKAGYFSVVTARALSSLPSLMELASPLLRQGGQLVCYKSSDIEDEIVAAQAIQEKLAMYMVGKRDLTLSDGETKRSIVVFRKDGEPLVKLPRREGQAQRKPYKK
jgi:16S rRNA (guanine527-N7)-methyltransferase